MSDDDDWPYPKPENRGGAQHLTPGLRLPDVRLASTLGADVDLALLSGQAIIFCYPWMGRPGLSNPSGWDDIPGAHGSTPQAEAYRDHVDQFRHLGISIYGLSQQCAEEQSAAAQRLRLPFALLCDRDGLFQRQLQLPEFRDGDGRLYIDRLTLFIDCGRLKHMWYPVHPPPRDAQTVLSFVRMI